ncbi:hypothetical protein FRC03_005317, partial [Tulasnella sp. 419]
TARLYVQKIPARKGFAVGTIFTNPGGPGGPGSAFLSTGTASILYNMTEGMFDIISWDPRGVGLSSPSINCFRASENTSFTQDLTNYYTDLLYRTLQAPSSGPNQADIDRLLDNATQIEGLLKSVLQTCIDNNGDEMKYVGTVATVRDLVALADTIDGPGSSINYWGFSYGSVLGSTLMDLYPGRVGRFVLDGIWDARSYSQKDPYKAYPDNIQNATKALQAFYDACASAGPLRCPIATNGASGQTVKEWVNALIDAAYNQSGSAVNSAMIRLLLSRAARFPSAWKSWTEQLWLISQSLGVKNTPNTHTRLLKRELPAEYSVSTASSQFAIWCGDSGDSSGTTTSDVLNEVVRVTREVSNVHGPLALIEFPAFYCHLWPFRAVERHQTPDLAPELANSVLVIGNTYDVITPLAWAQKLVFRLNSNKRQAALVQHNGSGHPSWETYSSCTWSIVQSYFTNGKLPEDTFCETETKGFFGIEGPSTTGTASTTATSTILSASSGPTSK